MLLNDGSVMGGPVPFGPAHLVSRSAGIGRTSAYPAKQIPPVSASFSGGMVRMIRVTVAVAHSVSRSSASQAIWTSLTASVRPARTTVADARSRSPIAGARRLT